MVVTATPRLPWPAELTSTPGWTMERARAQLAGLARTTWSVVRAVAASTLDVPQFEFKLAAGPALFELVELGAALESRLAELGARGSVRGQPPADRRRLALTLAADPATTRIGLLYGYWVARLAAELAAAEASGDSLLDGPSIRVVRRGAAEVAGIADWGAAAVAAACASPAPAAPDLAGGGLAACVRALAEATAGADEPVPARPRAATRDERFATFADTRSYRKAPDWADAPTPYETDLIELLRVNRDEIDAIETFAVSLYDLVDAAPLEALRHLARLAWDEARHAALGQVALAERGLDPYELSCSLIGIDVRAAMDGYDGWAQITLFGELGIIGPMRDLARRAREQGDARTAAVFDFICSDEVQHLKHSRELLGRLHPAGDLEQVAAAVRQRAAARLDELGVMQEEHFLALSRSEIFALIGE